MQLPYPTVIVKPVQDRTINPVFDATLTKVREIIKQDGYCNIREFKDIVEEHNIEPESLLYALDTLGYAAVKTEYVEKDIPQEVLVDLRYIAASMLLIYADGNYAEDFSVLEFVKGIHTYGTWHAAFPIALRLSLLEEVYSQLGHHFTYMALADRAILGTDHENVIYGRVVRHSHAIHELSKSDAELTAVYQLCVSTMHVVNDPSGTPQFDDYARRTFRKSVAYKHFSRLARKLIDKHLANREGIFRKQVIYSLST